MYLELSKELKEVIPPDGSSFEWFLHGTGTVHRDIKNRLTYEQTAGDLHFYVKRHLGCGWPAVFKEWYRLRKPVCSARTEWEAAEALAEAGLKVPKVLGKGERGSAPHAVESFVVLEALEDCETLEHFKEGWLSVTGRRWVCLKRGLIDEVASSTRTMHRAGMNHCDLYLNHFLINRTIIEQWQARMKLPLYLIDLHRVQQRAEVPERWLIKDLAALLFSALDVGLTSSDCIRFLQVYLGAEWKATLRRNETFWQKIIKRAAKLYTSFHKQPPVLPALLRAPNHAAHG